MKKAPVPPSLHLHSMEAQAVAPIYISEWEEKEP
jgi:hypothetical protein